MVESTAAIVNGKAEFPYGIFPAALSMHREGGLQSSIEAKGRSQFVDRKIGVGLIGIVRACAKQ